MRISAAYLAEQKRLHELPGYGVTSRSYAPLVLEMVNDTKAKSISDYGAGKCNLRHALEALGKTDFEYFPYDPAFPEYGPPRPADFVCCIDVLEHVEPEFLDAVLDDLKAIILKFGLITIHTGQATKRLSDGRNAHLIQKPMSWWLPRICERLEISHLERAPGGFWVFVEKQSDI